MNVQRVARLIPSSQTFVRNLVHRGYLRATSENGRYFLDTQYINRVLPLLRIKLRVANSWWFRGRK